MDCVLPPVLPPVFVHQMAKSSCDAGCKVKMGQSSNSLSETLIDLTFSG